MTFLHSTTKGRSVAAEQALRFPAIAANACDLAVLWNGMYAGDETS